MTVKPLWMKVIFERHDAVQGVDPSMSGGTVYRCVESGCRRLEWHAHCRRPYLVYVNPKDEPAPKPTMQSKPVWSLVESQWGDIE